MSSEKGSSFISFMSQIYRINLFETYDNHEKGTGALLYKNSFDRTITSFLATSNIGDLVVA